MAENVDRYLAELEHPLRAQVVALRAAILAVDPRITKDVKWNAPSFGRAGEHRVTFRLHPGRRIQVILHRGAAVRADAATFVFDDPTGLIEWRGDRGIIALSTASEADRHTQVVADLAQRWITATT
ncbi:DUF1801 domain-containing protein [Nakamurella sp. YIM 132087]|uniref:DUF1801 domain-containing protein n=1 Tax=Nakamurella alba TaxID=2665158 RepID=A0A7K1FU89_9ACTN|nr:DUF1801 domain-containing protein [Nakamurella alba]MTD16919.1 DUF1801 domain-containing protein [Nakamurella alba]